MIVGWHEVPDTAPPQKSRPVGTVSAYGVSPGLNGAKLRGIWGILLPRRGYRIQPRVSTLGNFNLAVRPEAHKEHGRITCDGGSGNVAWVWLQRSVSCGNWGKLIAHLASVGL